MCSIVEYFVELFFFPALKEVKLFFIIGTLGIIFGQLFRTGAMWTAQSNFHHLIRYKKEAGHVLVTSGLYGFGTST